ncbi:MAG: hypothetical protein AAF919_08135 [Pseudomonadota bacterium]
MGEQMERDDPKGLIRDAYAIEGIGPSECRSIFLDWALGVEGDPKPAIARLLARHGVAGHPMDAVLRDGLAEAPVARRRGGRAARLG